MSLRIFGELIGKFNNCETESEFENFDSLDGVYQKREDGILSGTEYTPVSVHLIPSARYCISPIARISLEQHSLAGNT